MERMHMAIATVRTSRTPGAFWILVGSCLSIPLVALPAMGQTPDATAREAQLRERLRSDYETHEVVIRDKGRSIEILISGDLSEPQISRRTVTTPLELSRAASASFFHRHADAIGLTRDVEVREIANRSDRHGGIHLVYRAFVEGVPVADTQLAAHGRPDLPLQSVNGEIREVSPEVIAGIRRARALERAPEEASERVRMDLLGREGIPDAEIVSVELLALNEAPYLVYDLTAVARVPGRRWRYRVSAVDERVLSRREDVPTIQVPHEGRR